MNNCLNCGKELNYVEGRRKKKFCNQKCKGEYWLKQKKEPKYVQFKSFKELKERFDAVAAENKELKFAKSVTIRKEEPLRSSITYQKPSKEAYDGSETDYLKQDEPLQYIQPENRLTQFEAYRQEILSSASFNQLTTIIVEMRKDNGLIRGEKMQLEQLATKHSQENGFYND